MKKVLITLGLVLAIAFSVSAQDVTTGIVGKGIKVGAGLSNFSGDVDGMDAKIGIGGGGFVTFAMSPSISIQPEVLFVQKGAKEDVVVEELGIDETFKVKLSYIEVPVLVRFNIPTEGNFKPALFAGPAVGFLMSAKAEDEDIKDELKSIDFGIAAGAGFDMPMGQNTLTFDVRYTLGMSNIDDSEAEDFEIKNTNISAFIGLSF